MSKDKALSDCTSRAIADFMKAQEQPEPQHLVTYLTFASSVFILLQKDGDARVKKAKRESFNFTNIVENIETVKSCLKMLNKDTTDYDNFILTLGEKDSKSVVELSDNKKIEFGASDYENIEDMSKTRPASIEDEDVLDDSDNIESFADDLTTKESLEDKLEDLDEDLEEYELSSQSGLSSKSDLEDGEYLEEIEFEDEIENEIENENIKKQRKQVDSENEHNSTSLSNTNFSSNTTNFSSNTTKEDKVFIIGSGEKKYKKGQNEKQRAQNMKIDKEYQIDINEPYKMLFDDLLKVSIDVANYILKVSLAYSPTLHSTSISNTESSVTLVDNILTVKIELLNFDKSYNLLSDHPSILIDDLLEQINLCDIYRLRKYLRTLMDAIKKGTKTTIKQYLIDMRDNVRSLPALETNRHKSKEKIKEYNESLRILSLSDTTNGSEQMADALSKVIREIETFLSFDNKAPCIEHCYKIVELFAVPVLIEEYELKKMIEKKYGVTFSFIEHDDVNDDEVKRYIDDYC